MPFHGTLLILRDYEGSTFDAGQQIGLAAVRRLLSREHFAVDGTLIEAWASIKSFRPVDEEPPGEDGGGDGTDGGGRNRPRDFHGARWSNATHRSTTDADSRLPRPDSA